MIHGTKRAVADGHAARRDPPDRPRAARPPRLDALPDARTTCVDARRRAAGLLPGLPLLPPRGPRPPRAGVRAGATATRPDLAGVLDALAPVLGDGAAARRRQRFQQTSGMVMAKGVEDCAFYRWARLTSLNEVGGDPSVFSVDRRRLPRRRWRRGRPTRPHAMTAASTHDTKRSEDVRARIAVLAEVPRPVGATRSTGCWSARPAARPGLRQPAVAGGGRRAGRATRRCATGCTRYAEKAMREAGDRTIVDRARRGLRGGRARGRRRGVRRRPGARRDRRGAARRRRRRVAATRCRPSCSASPSRASPTSTRAPSCGSSASSTPTTAARSTSRPRARSWSRDASRRDHRRSCSSTREALRLRRDRPELFTSYAPCPASGEAADHVLAFDRGGAVTVVTRLPRGAGRTRRLGRHRPRAARRPLARPAHRHRRHQRRQRPGGGAARPSCRWRCSRRSPSARAGAAGSTSGRRDRSGCGSASGDDGRRPERGPATGGDRPATARRARSTTATSSTTRTPRSPTRGRAGSPTASTAGRGPSTPSAFAWTDGGWRGRPLAGATIYELHVGTFTPEGTLDAAIERLDHLVDSASTSSS